ncbi:acyltransferase [Streptacidiphilus sp. ASG 303]|uniref:acyltransferase family protein n=1 Tax=Streptacidiphilus sp. ASG 303 TaxID=2896847 RepID=UPI001E34729B|nr:acyltransferase [Streptacidiphilus sp. ASG 303]MCD0482076.1 acyltransferase [Streptacidiphilus sp. ASG 303]
MPTRLRAPAAVPAPSQPPPAGHARPRLHVLDGIRLAAALMVVAFHYAARGKGWDRPVQQVFPHASLPASYGWLGVELFFLISGFVICMSCWGKSVGGFFVSRVVRLYPAYWFGVLATTLVLLAVPGGMDPHGPSAVLANLSMLQEPLGAPQVDGVYWTLLAELKFYLLFSLVVWRGVTYRRVVLFACTWAVASALLVRTDDGWLRQLLIPDMSWYFIAGMAMYLMYRFRPNALLAGIVAVCFLAGQWFALARLARTERQIGHDVPDWPVPVLLACFFGLMLLVATGRLSWISWRWLPTAGVITYPLYLLHENIGWEAIGLFQDRVPARVLLAVLVPGMLLAAWLVHRFVERPAARRLRVLLDRALEQAAEASRRPPRQRVHDGAAP